MTDKTEDGEEWRPVPGWPYEASNTGRVRRANNKRVVTTSISRKGYEHVALSRGGKRTVTGVHRVVHLAWNGPLGALQVNHKDGNKRNNVPANLEAVTGPENVAHSVATGLIATGLRNGSHTRPDRRACGTSHAFSKLTDEIVLAMRSDIASGVATKVDLAKRYGVSKSAVSQAVRGLTWKHVKSDAMLTARKEGAE